MPRQTVDGEATRRYETARQDVKRAVDDLVRSDHVDEERTEGAEAPPGFERRPLYPGASPAFDGVHPLPVDHLRAARAILAAARREIRDAIGNARGEGLPWALIGDALGVDRTQAKRHEMRFDIAAWRYAATGLQPDEPEPEWRFGGREPSVSWRCWACAGSITETNPELGPESQRGHGPGCARSKGVPGRRR